MGACSQGNMHEWMEAQFCGGQKDQMHRDLANLEVQCRDLLSEDPSSPFVTHVPDVHINTDGSTGAKIPIRRLHRLSQLGFAEENHPKSSAAMHAVYVCLETLCCGDGARTHCYPIEILYTWKIAGVDTLAAGDEIKPFSLVVFVGTAVTMTHYVFVLAVMGTKILSDPSVPEEVKKEVANRTMRALVITCTCDPQGSPDKQLELAMSAKMQASMRTRPTILSMMRVFEMKVEMIMGPEDDKED